MQDNGMTTDGEPSTKLPFGLSLIDIGKGGTVIILLAILYFGSEMYKAKDEAYVALVQTIGDNTAQLSTLREDVHAMHDEIGQLQITVAKLESANKP